MLRGLCPMSDIGLSCKMITSHSSDTSMMYQLVNVWHAHPSHHGGAKQYEPAVTEESKLAVHTSPINSTMLAQFFGLGSATHSGGPLPQVK